MENDLFGPRYPHPLPPVRKIKIVRAQTKMVVPCSSCGSAPGHLACSRCFAIKFCGKECQRRVWSSHKGTCSNIKRLREETDAAGKELMDQCGGEETFLQSPLVTRGRLRYFDVTHEPPRALGRSPGERYMIARQGLVEEYAKCGEETNSSVAFRLAAENMLDILCLSYHESRGEHLLWVYCGWMVGGGMDLEALNYLCYFRHRKLSPAPLHYLHVTCDEEIEGDTYLSILRGTVEDYGMWVHNFMLVALIKYKRLQLLMVRRWKAEQALLAFMMGTHPRTGHDSHTLMLRGKSPVIETIKSFVLSPSIGKRIDKLGETIEQMLSAVKERNPYIIPGILDRSSIPPVPELGDEDEFEDDHEFDEHGDDSHDAFWGFANYGSAWSMSEAYLRVLRHFLANGRVTTRLDNKRMLVEGVIKAAFDVDPTKEFGRDESLFAAPRLSLF